MTTFFTGSSLIFINIILNTLRVYDIKLLTSFTVYDKLGLVEVVGISRKISKSLVCISTLLHPCSICRTATHGESFLALGFAYPLFYSLQSRQRYLT